MNDPEGNDPAGQDPEGQSDLRTLARTVEALLFLSSDPVAVAELAEATEATEAAVVDALSLLGEQYAPGRSGIRLRELAGGWTLASDPSAEQAARRLFSRPRLATLTPAQAETLAIVAYLQPVSRPEITRIRGVSADSAAATLLEKLLFGVSPRDPLVYLAVLLAVVAVGLLANAIQARRAAALDPMRALRTE